VNNRLDGDLVVDGAFTLPNLVPKRLYDFRPRFDMVGTRSARSESPLSLLFPKLAATQPLVTCSASRAASRSNTS
jgi:hypothetical protein